MAQPLCLFLIQVVGLGFGPELVLGLDFLINFYSDLGAGGGFMLASVFHSVSISFHESGTQPMPLRI